MTKEEAIWILENRTVTGELKPRIGGYTDLYDFCLEVLKQTSEQPLTDIEKRIFLKAICREEGVCRKVDAEWGDGDPECEINLVHVCHEIERKVKGALWT